MTMNVLPYLREGLTYTHHCNQNGLTVNRILSNGYQNGQDGLTVMATRGICMLPLSSITMRECSLSSLDLEIVFFPEAG